MPDDLDTALRGLRDDLHAEIPLPDLTRIAGRARQRRTVRRTQIGAIAAVVLVSVVVPVLRSMPTDVLPPAEPPVTRSVPYTVDFVDAKHGYALSTGCTKRPDGRCFVTLLATADGGGTWQHRELPKGRGPDGGGDLTVLGPDRLAFSRFFGSGGERFVSDDGGRTWRAVDVAEAEVIGAPSPIPPGAKLAGFCIGDLTDQGCPYGLGVRAPGENRVAPVLTQPPLVDPKPGTAATAGGRFWTVGRDPATEKWAVSVTSDAGATWATTPLDLPGEPLLSDGWAVVESDGVMYATVEGSLVKYGVSGLLAVFRSTDGGVSWTRTWHAERIDRLWAIEGSTIAAADGRLVVNSMVEGTFESTDGGRTFTVAKQQLPLWRVQWTRGGYLAMGPDNRFEISRDGLDWRAFELP